MEYIFVDDGSTDRTLAIIEQLAKKYKDVYFISFSRNFGHQYALKAGLDRARGACAITMDADLQHPPKLIPTFIAKWQEGYDIVYTKRDDTNAPLFKKIGSRAFYFTINLLSSVDIPYGSADFRLLDRKVVTKIKNLQESVIFLRGLIRWFGFRQYELTYVPNKRYSGKSKYSSGKMFLFALEGITSFSVKPLKISTVLGFILSFFSGLYALYAVIIFTFRLGAISGWASVIVSVLFLGGVQLLMLGIIGEYLGALFMETKGRPSYIVNKTNIPHER